MVGKRVIIHNCSDRLLDTLKSNKNKKVHFRKKFIMMALFIGTLYILLFLVNNIEDQKDPEQYRFGFLFSDTNLSSRWILDPLLEYDFEKNKGSFSFYLSRSNMTNPTNITVLKMNFSEKIKKANLFIDDNENFINLSTDGKEISIVEDIVNYVNSSINISFEFEKSLIPEGTFIFNYGDEYHPISENSKEGNVKFILGKGYVCEYPCVFGSKNVYENPLSGKNEIILNFNPGHEEKKFKINTLWKSQEQKKTILFGFIVSIFSGLITPLWRLCFKK